MSRVLLLYLSCFVWLYGGDVVMMDLPYYQKEVRNTDLIYTKQNLKAASYAASVQKRLQPLYEDMFGYKMDEKLFVVLASPYNQIPNGFSSQYPNNRQVNYIGGALMIDYFSSSSWLDMLLYHESAHNYQMNQKDNLISSNLHKIFGNGVVYMPWFILPNIFESSFMAEGNAVLNESYHAKGGRLYSGRFYVETLLQAKADRLTPEILYNDHLHFLYGSHFYILGGYYFYYLAKKYGLKNANAYWKYHSYYWFWPFFTNAPLQKAIGIDFEESVLEWAKEMKKRAQKVCEAKGEEIVRSQFFTPLNDTKESIFFLINESGRDMPELVVYDKKRATFTKERGSWLRGKVIYDGKRYTTQAYNYINPWRITIALFDKDAQIIKGTGSKVIEGYLSNSKAIYFDVLSSYKEPQLYVGKKFYAKVNSSVYIYNDDLYYFVQEGKTRTLFKNKTPLMSFQGYYGHVVGVDSNKAIYFIANTKYGSGLFCYEMGKVFRVSQADTIIDARLIDDKMALVATVESDAYSYKKIALTKEEQKPYEVTLFFESQPYYPHNDKKKDTSLKPLDTKEPFDPLKDMHYSATNFLFGQDDQAGFFYDLSLDFSDPLRLNGLRFFLSRLVDHYTLTGVSYNNSQYFVDFMFSGYRVLQKPKESLSDKYGVFVSAQLPFLRYGYLSGVASISYYDDYQTDSKRPLSFELLLKKYERFGVALYPHLLLEGRGYYIQDRDNKIYGTKLTFTKGFDDEFYIEMGLKYSKSSFLDILKEKGVKLTNSILSSLKDADPSTVIMPSSRYTYFLDDVIKTTIDIKKVFDLDAYFFTFPISLRREAMTIGHSYYKLHQYNVFKEIQEYTTSILFDTYWFNRFDIPIKTEYRYSNDDTIAQRHSFRVLMGINF